MKIVTELYDAICSWFTVHPISSGGIMAFCMSVLRMTMKGERSIITILTESCICAFLSVGVTYLLKSVFGMSAEIAVFVGSMTGYIGADNVKTLVQKFLNNRILGGNDK